MMLITLDFIKNLLEKRNAINDRIQEKRSEGIKESKQIGTQIDIPYP